MGVETVNCGGEEIMNSHRDRIFRIKSEATVQLYDFNERLLGDRDREEVEKEFGVNIEVLHEGKRDPWRKAYTILVCGSGKAVDAFVGKYPLGDGLVA
ncbi:MAG: hypothetical protein Q8R13_01570 [bacterium]|nr:hypothetical protein [bacterium]